MNARNLTCVIPCKGRLHHLREILPNLLSQNGVPGYRVLVVDYGCPDDTFKWCQEHTHSQLDCIKVLGDTTRFHLSRARNCGNRLVKTDLIVALDTDCQLAAQDMLYRMVEPLLKQLAIVSHVLLIHTDGSRHPAHTCLAYKRDDWITLGGYDEQMTGWGYEDTDFFIRIYRHGKCHELEANYSEFYLIQHDNEIKTTYYEEKNRDISCKQNHDLSESRFDEGTEVNPNGFAVFDYKYYHGDTKIITVGNFSDSPRIL